MNLSNLTRNYMRYYGKFCEFVIRTINLVLLRWVSRFKRRFTCWLTYTLLTTWLVTPVIPFAHTGRWMSSVSLINIGSISQCRFSAFVFRMCGVKVLTITWYCQLSEFVFALWTFLFANVVDECNVHIIWLPVVYIRGTVQN